VKKLSTLNSQLFPTFDSVEGTFAQKRKEKEFFLLLFTRLFVPLQQNEKDKNNRDAAPYDRRIP
jgi:hypothetical protein